MASSQIDPARLNGDELARWYLRSPADIEQERQAGAAERYDKFFGRADRTVGQQDETSKDQSAYPRPAQEGAGRWGSGGGLSENLYDHTPDGVRKSAATANGGLCSGCHYGFPLLPVPLPLVPLFRDIPKFSPSGGAPDDRKQCEIQDKNDRQICGRQPFPEDKAKCNASATVRWKTCLRTGDAGDPPLDTAKRLRGR